MPNLLSTLGQSSKKAVMRYHPSNLKAQGIVGASVSLLILFIIILVILAFLWGQEPNRFDVLEIAKEKNPGELVTGDITTATLIHVAEVMLDKPGGYQFNDITPPTVFMDNIPNWEFGVLVQIRDLARALRNDMSRSQSQSIENKDLAIAEPQFSFNNNSWLFPPTESEYGKGIKALTRYLEKLGDPKEHNYQFYARADNLVNWLQLVSQRLGSLSQRLSASVGETRKNIDLAGDAEAKQSTPTSPEVKVKTPWLEIDDIFYEARGTTWALIHFLEAIEIDFKAVLKKKNALVSLQQIIRELEATQATVWSPMIVNGGGFGLFANHSLVMSSYIARANAAIIDLRNLLTQG